MLNQKTSSGLFLLGLVCAACGSDGGRPPPAQSQELPDLSNYDSSTADSRDVWARGGCEAGTSQECRVYLPAHDGIQPCFVGVQSCTEGEWGACEEGELVDANDEGAALDTGETAPAP